MVIPTTSVAFIVLAVGLSVFGFMFLRAYRKTNTSSTDKRIGLLLSIHFLGFAIQTGIILGLGTLVFAENQFLLFCIVTFANITLTLLSALSIYIVYYIFFLNNHILLP